MTHKLIIDLPNAVDLPPDVLNDQRTLRDGIAALLYKQGRIGPAQAAGMMGLNRRAFEDRLADFGYATMDESDFDAEIAAAERLVPRREN
jgi:predicted HTH domain antitoxin